MTRTVSWIVTAVALLAAAHAVAQETQQAEPVLVTATRTETPAGQLGAAVTVITGDEIDTRRYPTVDEALRMVTRLRKGLNSATLPIVVLMAKGREELMVRALEVGADDCLEAPAYPPLALARIRALMGRWREMAAGVDQRQRFDLVVRGAGDGIWD